MSLSTAFYGKAILMMVRERELDTIFHDLKFAFARHSLPYHRFFEHDKKHFAFT